MFSSFDSSTHPCGHRHEAHHRDHAAGRRAHFARFFGGRGEHGPFAGGRGPFGAGAGPDFGRRGFGGGGRERMFDTGEFQLVILSLLAEKPSYGYELIKTLEGRLGGGYAPSPGVIYPTLTMLEEEGLTEAATVDGGKKVYTVTEAGHKHLESHRERVHEILDRLTEAGQGFEQGRRPEFRQAFKALQRAVLGAVMRARVSGDGLTPEQMRRITDALETAARAIDAV